MATCKDCVHYDVCEEWSVNVNGIGIIEDGYKICKTFKDKSRYIELPCKFLQKCFVIPTIENRLTEITEMKCIGICDFK